MERTTNTLISIGIFLMLIKLLVLSLTWHLLIKLPSFSAIGPNMATSSSSKCLTLGKDAFPLVFVLALVLFTFHLQHYHSHNHYFWLPGYFVVLIPFYCWHLPYLLLTLTLYSSESFQRHCHHPWTPFHYIHFQFELFLPFVFIHEFIHQFRYISWKPG